ncbi:MAG: AAA family ATPase [Bacteroidota bacterium]
MKEEKKLIVLIGGPSTGKSTTLKALENKGYTCFPEVSREVTLEAQRKGIDQLFLTEPLLFSEKLLEGRIKQYRAAQKIPDEVIFIDRGIPDITAYMDFGKETYPKKFSQANYDYPYQKIFFFPIWDKIYIQDNERYEDLALAKKIENQLVKSYEDLGYSIIEVPKTSISKRLEFIEKNI